MTLRQDEIEKEMSTAFRWGVWSILGSDLSEGLLAVSAEQREDDYKIEFEFSGDLNLWLLIRRNDIDETSLAALRRTLEYHIQRSGHEIRQTLMVQRAQFFVSGLARDKRDVYKALLIKIRDDYLFRVSEMIMTPYGPEPQEFCDTDIVHELEAYKMIEVRSGEIVAQGLVYAKIADWGLFVLDELEREA